MLRALAARDAHGVHARVFVLGGRHEARNNLASQQDRALNLLSALDETRDLKSARIAVAGGGLAGATFAAGAALLGAKVVVLDEHEEPVSMQRWTRDRYLHPNLFDWPLDGWDEAAANAPILNWQAGPAADVRAQVVAGLAGAAAKVAQPGSLKLCTQTTLNAFRNVGEKVEVTVQDLRAMADDGGLGPVATTRSWRVDILVLATGFLPEGRFDVAGRATMSGSYWRGLAGVAALLASSGGGVVPVVVGDGDGALTDALACLLVGANAWQTYLPGFLALATTPALQRALLDAEAGADDLLGGGTLELLRGLAGPGLATFDMWASVWVRRQAAVEIRARPPALRRNAFLVSRLLVSRLAGPAVQAVTVSEGAGTEQRDVAAMPGVPVIWRVGPRRAERSRVAEPAVDFRTPAREASDPYAAAVIDELLDATRIPNWSRLRVASDRVPARLPDVDAQDPAAPQLAQLEVDGRAHLDTTTTVRANWGSRVEISSAPPHLNPAIEQLCWAYGVWVAALGTDPWWATTCPQCAACCVSLDFASMWTDLTPGELLTCLAGSGGPYRAYRLQRQFGGRDVDRTWVHGEPPNAMLAIAPHVVADLLSLAWSAET